jgi:hypothetical protein
MSIGEFASTTTVNPIVNRNTNPIDHRLVTLYVSRDPCSVASHLKILVPVGTAMITQAREIIIFFCGKRFNR